MISDLLYVFYLLFCNYLSAEERKKAKESAVALVVKELVDVIACRDHNADLFASKREKNLHIHVTSLGKSFKHCSVKA